MPIEPLIRISALHTLRLCSQPYCIILTVCSLQLAVSRMCLQVLQLTMLSPWTDLLNTWHTEQATLVTSFLSPAQVGVSCLKLLVQHYRLRLQAGHPLVTDTGKHDMFGAHRSKRAQGQDGVLSGSARANTQHSQSASPPPALPVSGPGAPPALPVQQLLGPEDSLQGAGFNLGALKRPRSSGMPIPTSRPQMTVQPYASPLETAKRSRSAGRTTVTRVPALQTSPSNFMRFGSLAETGPSTSSQSGLESGFGGGLEGGLSSAPATLTGGLLQTDLDTSLSSMEYEMMESMAGSGGGSGSSGTALGGTLASTADAHECADSKVRRRLPLANCFPLKLKVSLSPCLLSHGVALLRVPQGSTLVWLQADSAVLGPCARVMCGSSPRTLIVVLRAANWMSYTLKCSA